MKTLKAITPPKTLILLILISTTALATVQITSPVEQTLEPGETLDLTEVRNYPLPVNIRIDIEKNNWVNATSEDLGTFIRDLNNTLAIYLTNTPDQEGNHTSEITFIDQDGETQTNTIIYTLEEKMLSTTMEYPVKKELPRDESTNIGKVAPGQRFKLLVRRDMDTGRFAWGEAELENIESTYYHVPRDKLLEETLPLKTIQDKNIDTGETYIAIEATAPTQTGEHTLQLKLDSDYTDRATRELTLEVDRHAYTFKTQNLSKNAGESAQIQSKIKSNSIAVENFTYTPITLPKQWVADQLEQKTIQVIPGETKEFTLPIQINQEGQYTAEYEVIDTTGREIEKQSSIVTVNPTLRSKLKGFGKGHSLTLPILQPFYSLLNLFS